MGAYRYCGACNAGWDKPTLREVLIVGEQECHRDDCYYVLTIDKQERTWALEELLERFEAVEAALGLLK